MVTAVHVLRSMLCFKLKAITEILQSKLVKRGVPIKNLTYGTVNSAAGSTVKQEVTLTSGIPIEKEHRPGL